MCMYMSFLSAHSVDLERIKRKLVGKKKRENESEINNK